MTTFHRLLLGALLLLAHVFGQSPAGTLHGSLTTEDGAPIAGASVHYRRVTRMVRAGRRLEMAPGEVSVSNRITSDTSGAFFLPNLPAGDYVVCAEVPSAAYLNSCMWSTPPKVTVTAGAVSRPALVLRKGVFLRVRVNDPAGLLPVGGSGPLRVSNLIIGVLFGNGAFLGAENISADRTGRDYQMVIPANLPLKLWVFSRHVTLMNAQGLPVDNSGARIPFQAGVGQDYRFTLTVSGRAAQ